MEAWVAAGGSLFLNAAPNERDGMNFGFGGVSLVYPGYTDSVKAVDGTHAIFNGPNGAAGTSFNGGWFGHGLTGGSLTPLIVDSFNASKIVLGEKDWGLGHVIFGGMTTNNFQSPTANTANLRANILDYGAGQVGATAAAPVPLPAAAWAGMALMGATGLTKLRRRKAEAV